MRRTLSLYPNPMPKAISEKTHRMILAIFGVLIIANLIVIGSLWKKQNQEVELSSEDPEVGEYYIEPDEVDLAVSDSYTFNAYVMAATGAIATNSSWSVDGDAELEDCSGNECTVIAGETEGEVTLTATAQGNTAEATINVEVVEVNLGFSDEIPDWATTYIGELNDREIMVGYADGSFGAGDPVTRGQFVTLLYRLMPIYGLDVSGLMEDYDCEIYTDLTSEHYAYEPMCFAHNNGWLDELTFIPSSTVSPNESITRAEAAELYAGALGRTITYSHLENYWGVGEEYFETVLEFIAEASYADVNDSTTYKNGIDIAYVTYIMTGSYNSDAFDYYFYPTNTLNRAETATIIYRILVDVIEQSDIEFNTDDVEDWIEDSPV